VKNGKTIGKTIGKTAPSAAFPKSQPLDVILRQMGSAHAQALMAEHLAEYCAEAFRGDDSRGPRKLLRLPNGSTCRAEVDDVLEIEATLLKLAAEAREQLARLNCSTVVVADVAGREVSTAPAPAPIPEGEGVADSKRAQ